MIQGEEISDEAEGVPVHMNATNIQEVIEPQGGKTVAEAIDNNLRAVEEQAKRTGKEILVHLNHPNFGYAVTAEDIASGDSRAVRRGLQRPSRRRPSRATSTMPASSKFGTSPTRSGSPSSTPRRCTASPPTIATYYNGTARQPPRPRLDHGPRRQPRTRNARPRDQSRRLLRLQRRHAPRRPLRRRQEAAAGRYRTGRRRAIHDAVHRHQNRLRRQIDSRASTKKASRFARLESIRTTSAWCWPPSKANRRRTSSPARSCTSAPSSPPPNRPPIHRSRTNTNRRGRSRSAGKSG